MEELFEGNQDLVYCLNQVNTLISEIDKFNSKLRICNKNASLLGIGKVSLNSIFLEDIESLKNMFNSLIENSYNNSEEIQKAKEELEVKTKEITEAIKKEKEYVEKSQIEEIYQKAQRAIYVAKWRAKENEISYLNYKDNFISKITGEAKNRKLSIERKKLESELIKKEYYEEATKYNGESIREIVLKLSSVAERDYDVINLKDKLIKIYMLDESTINSVPELDWVSSSIVPYGFFDKIKYYRTLNRNLSAMILSLKEKLSGNRFDSFEVEENKLQKVEKKLFSLEKINKEIKNLISGIKMN